MKKGPMGNGITKGVGRQRYREVQYRGVDANVDVDVDVVVDVVVVVVVVLDIDLGGIWICRWIMHLCITHG
jgi:hypothetical protein